MPFKVTFRIYEAGKKGASITTTDKDWARVEFADLKRKQPMARMTTEIECINLNSEESYVWMVYQTRKAKNKWLSEGRKRTDLDASLSMDRQLSNRNYEIQKQLAAHPERKKDSDAYRFYRDVVAWQMDWDMYHSAKARREPQVVLDGIKENCNFLQEKIDKYIKQYIGF